MIKPPLSFNKKKAAIYYNLKPLGTLGQSKLCILIPQNWSCFTSIIITTIFDLSMGTNKKEYEPQKLEA
ncbi:MAG: hypothetical protein EBX05_03095, partial [Rhodobacteraceae bacterium]|nr:hypothetical protein [Paracoccaceae bacterium]